MAVKKILLVDDHPLLRKGIRLMIEEEQDMSIVGEAGDGKEAIELVHDLTPDVVVMDITMPKLGGIEATRYILQESPDTKVIALSIHAGKVFVEDMLRAGAAGYLLKGSVPEELVQGIRAVAGGRHYLSSSITGIVLSDFMKPLSHAKTVEERANLTADDMRLIRLVTEGNTMNQVASIMKVSPKTVGARQQRVMEKLGMGSVAELVEYTRAREWFGKEGSVNERIKQPIGDTASKVQEQESSRNSTMDVVIRTKLYRPPVTQDLVHRGQLIEKLEKYRTKSLTLISAAAGYGKSMLASMWLDACACPSAWLSLDENDNDLRLFLTYLVSAIQTMFPSACQNIRTYLESHELPPLSFLSQHLHNDLNEIDEAFVLILDDYHSIHDMAIHELIISLLDPSPENINLVVLTRRDPPFPLNKLRARGQLNEITHRELRFTNKETAEFLKNIFGITVHEAAAALIVEKLEGWPAGLRLVAHSVRDKGELEKVLSGMQGGFTYIVEYLVDEILSRQPQAIINLLLKTSLLDRFCSPLCDAMNAVDTDSSTEKMEGAEFILWLEKNNLFLNSLDSKNYWFRYHHLFKQCLQDQLKRQYSTDHIAALSSQAIKWFLQNGYKEEGLRHALAAGNLEDSAQIVEENRYKFLEEDKWYVLAQWLNQLPRNYISKRTGLLVAQAWVTYHQLKLGSVPPILESIVKLSGKDELNAQLMGEINFFKGCLCYHQCQGVQSEKYLESSAEQIPELHQHGRAEVELHHALAMHMNGRKEMALRGLRDSLHRKQPIPVIYSTRLWAGFAFIHLLEGELPSALDAGRQILNIATDRQSLYAESWGSYVESLIYLTWYDLKKAEQHFSKIVNDRYVMHTRATIDSLFALALVYQIMQQSDKADKTMEILHEFSRYTNDLTYLSIASSCQAHLSLLRKDVASAVRWQKTADLTLDEGHMLWWLEVPRLTECRVLIAEGSDASLKNAVAKLQKFEQENAAIHNTFQMVHILSLLALAFRKQEYIDKASATLKRALELAEPGGFIMSFTNMGPLMTDLLKRLVSQNICVDFIGKLLTVVEDAKQVVVSEAAKPKVAPTAAMDSELIIEPLTNRELAILELLEQRLQTKEIADRLFISAETVKKHLQHIYQKLYASNRREAVSKARALGILIS